VPIDFISRHLYVDHQKAQDYVVKLINEGLLHAQIEPTVGQSQVVVRFLQDNGSLDVAEETQLALRLREASSRIEALERDVAVADHRLQVTKEYAEDERRRRKAKQEQKEAEQKEAEGAEGQNAMDTSGPAPPNVHFDEEGEMDIQ